MNLISLSNFHISNLILSQFLQIQMSRQERFDNTGSEDSSGHSLEDLFMRNENGVVLNGQKDDHIINKKPLNLII